MNILSEDYSCFVNKRLFVSIEESESVGRKINSQSVIFKFIKQMSPFF
ncbi:hypothetical protein LEP1GSC065_0927 [Leptospira kirschneri serovar Sokoine str. RM1]|nr:hypothetical protein LEP1GSC065_0927 [Leptospira kirschneri serovar Sokoine str. RM1]